MPNTKSINWKTKWEINYYELSPLAAVNWLDGKLRERAPVGDLDYQYHLISFRTENGRLICVVEAIVTAVGDFFPYPAELLERNAFAIRKGMNL